MCTIELEDSRSEKAAKGIAHLLRNVETGKSLSQFLLRVPRREIINCSWKKHRFDDSEEGPDDKKLFVRLHRRCRS